jgi:predicted acylesterase/phospholipase RssA
VDLALVLAAVLYPLAMLMRWPWPWRFHGLVLVVLTLIWLGDRPGAPRTWMRRLVLGLMPETQGRGLWRSAGRRRLIDRLVAQGDPARLTETDVHLIISACSVNDGRMSYFVNWRDPSERFCQNIRAALGEVEPVTRPRDVIDAATAASAVPVLFEPVRWRGRDYLDGGIFSNQPIHAVVADGADAILLVLVSPSSGPRAAGAETSVVELGWRLQELANWRDLQTELRQLDGRWKEEDPPRKLCVVEPREPLSTWMFAFDAVTARRLIDQGEADAWKALERAGWIGTARPDTPAPPKERRPRYWQREVEWLTRASRVLAEQSSRLRRKRS